MGLGDGGTQVLGVLVGVENGEVGVGLAQVGARDAGVEVGLKPNKRGVMDLWETVGVGEDVVQVAVVGLVRDNVGGPEEDVRVKLAHGWEGSWRGGGPMGWEGGVEKGVT